MVPRFIRAPLLFALAGLATTYLLRDARGGGLSDPRNMYTNAVVVVVFAALYWQRGRVAAVVEGLLVSLGCGCLTRVWWWLEDWGFGGASAADVPPLGGLDSDNDDDDAAAMQRAGHAQPPDCECAARGGTSGGAGGRNGGCLSCSSSGGDGGGGGGGVAVWKPPSLGTVAGPNDAALGLDVAPDLRERWARDAEEAAEHRVVFDALLPRRRRGPRHGGTMQVVKVPFSSAASAPPLPLGPVRSGGGGAAASH